MVEDANPTEKNLENASENAQAANLEGTSPEGIEELKLEDGTADIDFEADFSEGDPAGDAATGAATSDSSRAARAELEHQVTALKAQLEDRTRQYLRITADFENFRKRTSREKEDLETQIKSSTLKALLDVVDNFERARSQIKPQTDGEMTIHKSYQQGVYKQLVDALKKLGVTPMRAAGQAFDPNLHEAVMREATDEFPEGTVIDELVRGYLLGERVLRHAMVKVAMPPEPGSQTETLDTASTQD